MSELELPQIYLITPPDFDFREFPEEMARVLDATEIACVRLALATTDEDRILRSADALREITHQRDIALVIERHVLLAERLGLDGVHLTDGARSVRATRKQLGDDAIVGSFCAASRHDGMNAGESGADYVSFGPVGGTALGDGTHADLELFGWWTEMIELPVVAEGALTEDLIRAITPVTDFFGIGSEIWGTEDPAATLKKLVGAMG
ncbi:thiamine phosphate synthase [Donghicola sp. C2-DW-16]|uniref:Thiamine phosphate synthase n=1 Tax=Donghicola mangrovi TaxID=2729614 RepID=A0A850Q8K3_9RHOB|nr:thiamine phosphate synthase [Donghicola mangrovi]NVO22649.1 thiamine phosphate synthase [Donghicola mangrovi]NVO27595.1 thiamine phosphate synthase [Donghicola mangrovi]